MNEARTGQYVKVIDGRVWIRPPGREWMEILRIGSISLNMLYHPYEIGVGEFGHLSIADLGLDIRGFSRLTGCPRLDERDAERIWNDPQSLRGTKVAIDLVHGELTYTPAPERYPPELVDPFRSFAALRLGAVPHLIRRWPIMTGTTPFGLEGVSMSPEELAHRMGLPLLQPGQSPPDNAIG